MPTSLRSPARERALQLVLRFLSHLLPRRDSKTAFGGPVEGRDTGPEDDGSAGVREPRRPRPDLPSLAVTDPHE